MDTKMQPLTSAVKPGWTVTVDGKKVSVNEMVAIENLKFGRLTYGKNPAGNYDSWAFHENGGGGSVTILFTIAQGQLFVGVVLEQRPFQADEPVLNVIRGFLDPGETHLVAAARETEEEAGISIPLIDLGGGGNPNSTFFETWGEGEGVHFWGGHVSSDTLKMSEENGVYVFDSELVQPANKDGKPDKTGEKILGSQFIPWNQAAVLGDLFSRGAVSGLMSYLDKSRVMSATFGEFDPEIARFIELRQSNPAMATAMLNLVDMAGAKTKK